MDNGSSGWKGKKIAKLRGRAKKDLENLLLKTSVRPAKREPLETTIRMGSKMSFKYYMPPLAAHQIRPSQGSIGEDESLGEEKRIVGVDMGVSEAAPGEPPIQK